MAHGDDIAQELNHRISEIGGQIPDAGIPNFDLGFLIGGRAAQKVESARQVLVSIRGGPRYGTKFT
jgi:hypothetical protein